MNPKATYLDAIYELVLLVVDPLRLEDDNGRCTSALPVGPSASKNDFKQEVDYYGEQR